MSKVLPCGYHPFVNVMYSWSVVAGVGGPRVARVPGELGHVVTCHGGGEGAWLVQPAHHGQHAALHHH